MNKIATFNLMFIFITYSAFSQITDFAEEFSMPTLVNESSGLIFFNDKLITHNDSGGEHKLYEIDPESGLITRTVTISNATNVDWEDLAQDDNNIYIADIGNNSGTRTDLVIYKISKTAYAANTSVTAETISISYDGQSDFMAHPNATEWDAEALISYSSNDLILISKNWVDGVSSAYLVPKTPGSYSISPLTTTLNSGGLITGATFNTLSGKIFLVGYTNLLQPFIWKIEDFSSDDVFSGTNTQTFLTSFSIEQTEAITFVDEKNYFVSSESFSNPPFSDYGKVISFSTNDNPLGLPKFLKGGNFIAFPNPVIDLLQIEGDRIKTIEVYDTRLIRLYRGTTSQIDMSQFEKGMYILKINDEGGIETIQKILKL